MGKTRDLFKKIRDTKGTFYAKMGSIKDRNGMDLTEAEDIKKRWQEYTDNQVNRTDVILLAFKRSIPTTDKGDESSVKSVFLFFLLDIHQ